MIGDLEAVFDFLKWFINLVTITVAGGLIFYLMGVTKKMSDLKALLDVQIKYLSGEIRNHRGAIEQHDNTLEDHGKRIHALEQQMLQSRHIHQSHARSLEQYKKVIKQIVDKAGLKGHVESPERHPPAGG